MKLVIDVPVKEFPTFFQSCQEIGLTGEGVYYFFLSLDFHGQTNPLYAKTSTRMQTHRLTDAEIQELIFKDVGGDQENNNSSIPRYYFLADRYCLKVDLIREATTLTHFLFLQTKKLHCT